MWLVASAWACKPALPPVVAPPPGPVALTCDEVGCALAGAPRVPWFRWSDACHVPAVVARHPVLGRATPDRRSTVWLATDEPPTVTLPAGWRPRPSPVPGQVWAARPGVDAGHGGPVVLGGADTRGGLLVRGGWEAALPTPVVWGAWLDSEATAALTAELATRAWAPLPIGAGMALGAAWDLRAARAGLRATGTLAAGPVRVAGGPTVWPGAARTSLELLVGASL